MASGVKVADDVRDKFEEIKKKKTMRYLIIHIKGEKVIEVEKVGDRSKEYRDFLTDVMAAGPKDCRYGVFDYEYSHQCEGTTEASKKQKLILMAWCPDTATIKKKMLYSSSFDALKKCLVGIAKCIQATDEMEADKDTVLDILRKMDRV